MTTTTMTMTAIMIMKSKKKMTKRKWRTMNARSAYNQKLIKKKIENEVSGPEQSRKFILFCSVVFHGTSAMQRANAVRC